jgi:hypothetical protein
MKAARWFPIKGRRFVIDALRGFGQPLVIEEGVPTLFRSNPFGQNGHSRGRLSAISS